MNLQNFIKENKSKLETRGGFVEFGKEMVVSSFSTIPYFNELPAMSFQNTETRECFNTSDEALEDLYKKNIDYHRSITEDQ